MRSVTLVQGFQYWLKLVAILVPALLLLAAWRADGTPSALTSVPPTFRTATTVEVGPDVTVVVGTPVQVEAQGSIDGVAVEGPVGLGAGRHALAAGTRLEFPAGAEVPHAVGTPISTGARWGQPLQGEEHPMYRTYALMLALFLGTMGLPHVLVRFYTNPDGRQARRTALIVIGLVGLFYLAPSVYGMLGRLYAPELLMTGRTDAVVLLLPGAMLGGGLQGQLVTALVCAGAAAAFLATATGLTVTVAGVLSQDVVGRWVSDPIRSFRWAAVVSVLVPLALGLLASSLPLARAVALAFTVAAATFCPLLLLGIWWPKLTDAGAFTGLVTGGALALGAILASTALPDLTGWPAALLAQPAAWAMPLALATMVVVSRATAHRLHPGVSRIMIRLHTPESARLRTTWTARGTR
jgi:Na+(H+)/acetate symporter ActP